MKLSKFQQLMNFLKKKLKLTANNQYIPITDDSPFENQPNQLNNSLINNINQEEMLESQVILEDIDFNKINNHLLNLFKTFQYDEMIEIISSIPERKIHEFFFSNNEKENDSQISLLILNKTLDIFSKNKINKDEKDITNFFKLMKHSIFNQMLCKSLNKEYEISRETNYPIRRWAFYNFNKKVEYDQTFFSTITNKLFNIDFKQKKYIYKGLDALPPFEKQFINFSFDNIKNNLSKNNSKENYLYLFTDSFTLLAFLYENPEFQTHHILSDENNNVLKYFSNYNSAIQIIDEKISKRNEGTYSHIEDKNAFKSGNSIFQEEFDRLTKLQSIMVEHNKLLNQLTKTYGNHFLNTINNSTIPEDLSEKIKNKYFELEKWKHSFTVENDGETLSVITNSQKSLLNIISIYEQIKDISPETDTATSLIQDVLNTIDNQILSYSEQNLNSIILTKNLSKKIF